MSNLSFVSKVIEKVVAKQLTDHMIENELNEQMQSAYRAYHSTETALIRVQNDILLNLDKKRSVLLVLLDLSAAFDTIDHHTLFDLLNTRLGVHGKALQWFISYLTQRSQSVSINGETSNPEILRYGVPQGSVLGPLLYTIYTLPLGDLLRSLNVPYHFYADDTQLYLSCPSGDDASLSETSARMERCVAVIKNWMVKCKLKLNDDKTEAILISSPFYARNLRLDSFTAGDTTVTPVSSVRNIT